MGLLLSGDGAALRIKSAADPSAEHISAGTATHDDLVRAIVGDAQGRGCELKLPKNAPGAKLVRSYCDRADAVRARCVNQVGGPTLEQPVAPAGARGSLLLRNAGGRGRAVGRADGL